ncbi:TIGR02466 family protein [Sphingomonas jeddahensis]|uniref:Fe2OG dioxygenase domain-containing protein n=1 Tax=Sphingomonas jeddahensis TaxID=1915074 RepID=A0A1V2EWA7_9SPHN|nr:TIGR02466 family protein [Sphingomonas jeddahensis]ONF96966.1 hypothetical protein SPHI_11630 [Sphingomonas jeddahensis]
MTTRALFPTLFYEGQLGDESLVEELEASVRALASDDTAGKRWSKDHGYRGYTSYASLDDLPQRDPAFADLKRHLDRHVARFAADCGFQLGGKKLKLDSLWVNLLKPGGAHSGHIHPHSVVSGTIYVTVPPGSGALRLEDPRLGLMMAAPPRGDTFVHAEPAPGTIFLWESWLRHEVMQSTAKSDRISVSFNYKW